MVTPQTRGDEETCFWGQRKNKQEDTHKPDYKISYSEPGGGWVVYYVCEEHRSLVVNDNLYDPYDTLEIEEL